MARCMLGGESVAGVQVGRREVKSISAGMELANERGSECQCKVDMATILYRGASPNCIEE